MDPRVLGTVKTPTVLVAAGQDPPAVVTWLVVQAHAGTDSNEPAMSVIGEPWLDSATLARWHDLLVPHVADGLHQLDVGTVRWRLGLRVPDAVAHSGRACRVEGASADAACFVGLIGAALGIKARRDTLVTGTIQLEAQSLGLVQALPEKLHAAAGDRAVRRFIHAPVDHDQSAGWTPQVLLAWDRACEQTDHRVQRMPCTALAEVVRRVLPLDARVIAALRHGLFNAAPIEHAPQWVNVLRRVDDTLWRRQLDRRVQAGHQRAVQQLFEARLIHDLHRERYPSGIGDCLSGALQTVPTGRRRSRLGGLLISTDLLNRCEQAAGEQDRQDMEQLAIATGHRPRPRNPRARPGNDRSGGDGSGQSHASPEASLDWLLENLSGFEIAQRIDRALDEARMSFVVEPGQDWTNESVLDQIASFYAHLRRRIGRNVPAEVLMSEATAFVNRAYDREGGLDTAVANAKDHIHSGLRGVLDRMTDAMKEELRLGDRLSEEKFALNERDMEARLVQTRHLLSKFSHILPEHYRDIPPELLITKLPTLIQVALNSGDQMIQQIRSS